MVGYTIHYTDNDGTESTNADSTSVDISALSSLCDDEIYTVIVEARSEHLSGESEPMSLVHGRSTSLYITDNCHVFHNIKGIYL